MRKKQIKPVEEPIISKPLERIERDAFFVLLVKAIPTGSRTSDTFWNDEIISVNTLEQVITLQPHNEFSKEYVKVPFSNVVCWK